MTRKIAVAALAALVSVTALAHEVDCEKQVGILWTDAEDQVVLGEVGAPKFVVPPKPILVLRDYPVTIGWKMKVNNLAGETSIVRDVQDPFLASIGAALPIPPLPFDLAVGESRTFVVPQRIESYEQCLALGGTPEETFSAESVAMCRGEPENRLVVTTETNVAECRARLVCRPQCLPGECPLLHPPLAGLVKFWALERFAIDGKPPVLRDSRYQTSLLAKAKPDECFNGVGEPITKPDANGVCATGQPKVNDAYVWGLTRVGDNLFFGTLANTLCLVMSGYLGVTAANVTPEWVCEFGASKSGTGDFRAPNMFRYDLSSQELVSLNPTPLTPADVVRRRTTGFRSAGSLNGVAFLAGPAAGGGVSFFAFDGDTAALLAEPKTFGAAACATAPAPDPIACPSGARVYNNVRMWAVANGGLYVGVGTLASGVEGGAVLRWVGDAANPYRFVEVGRLPADAANMVFHGDGRIYLTTWPSEENPSGLYRSPPIPAEGLTATDAGHPDWTTPLWLATRDGNPDHAGVPAYDPDRVTGFTTGGGALASYQGKIYFGTMSVPFLAAQRAQEAYLLPSGDLLRTALGTHRSIALFEVDFPNGVPSVSMIVGEKYLPTFDAVENGYTIAYDGAHATGFEPRWAPSGFGNFFNTYTWAMSVFEDQVFVGTFDWSQLARVEIETMLLGSDQLQPEDRAALIGALGDGLPGEGADLFRFDGSMLAAESIDGVGNNRNYGVRNMINDGTTMWLGMANPMNLDPLGGWELIELK